MQQLPSKPDNHKKLDVTVKFYRTCNINIMEDTCNAKTETINDMEEAFNIMKETLNATMKFI